MKKIALLTLAASFALISCKKETTNPSGGSFPTDNLTVDKDQKVMIIEMTGAWCQYCPNGAEKMVEEKAKHGDRALAIAAHTGDVLESVVGKSLMFNFMDTVTSVPSFFVMDKNSSGGDLAQDVMAGLYPPTPSNFAVKHAIVDTDSAINVYAKVEVVEGISNENFFVQSYVLVNGIEARDYGGGVDLNQVSSVPIVSTGSGATPSKWALDAAIVDGEPQKKSGDIYTHDEVIYAVAENTQDIWGHNLGDINPFGNEFLPGDILGTKYTPIMLSIDKQGLNYSQFQGHASIMTIVWKFRSDGSGRYDFINGYISHLD